MRSAIKNHNAVYAPNRTRSRRRTTVAIRRMRPYTCRLPGLPEAFPAAFRAGPIRGRQKCRRPRRVRLRRENPARPRQLVGLALLILGFALTAADRRAENVAKAGAGIGRTEFLHCPLLLVNLARLDRQRDPPRRPVDRGDFRVDPLADRETVRALLATIARQLGFADEAGNVVGQHHLDAALVDSRDRAGDDLALPEGDHALLERIGFELLDAEADTLLVDIDVEHLDLNHLALAVILDRVLAGAVPVDVRQVDHAVDIARQAHEQPELGRIAHFALDGAADRVLFDEGL